MFTATVCGQDPPTGSDSLLTTAANGARANNTAVSGGFAQSPTTPDDRLPEVDEGRSPAVGRAKENARMSVIFVED